MTSLDFNTLNQTSKDQLAVTLAALILHDDKSDVTADAISKILKSANVTVAAYWPTLFAKALEGKNVGDFLSVGGGSGSGPAPAQAGAAADKKDDKKEEKKKEEKPAEEAEEVDMDMGDLFGF